MTEGVQNKQEINGYVKNNKVIEYQESNDVEEEQIDNNREDNEN